MEIQALRLELEQAKALIQQNNVRVQQTNIEVEKLKMELQKLKSAPSSAPQPQAPPVGFIYVQYAHQADSRTLWPRTNWQDVTHIYAGLFFRALGGSASSFGVTQAQEIPRISKVSTRIIETVDKHGGRLPGNNPSVRHEIDVPQTAGASDDRLFLGDNRGGDYYGMQFHITGNEVRPQNQGIKIWKRMS